MKEKLSDVAGRRLQGYVGNPGGIYVFQVVEDGETVSYEVEIGAL